MYYEEKEVNGLIYFRTTPRGNFHLKPPQIDKLIEVLKQRLNYPNTKALCKDLGLHPATFTRIRHKRMPVPPEMLVRMHDRSGMSISELRKIGNIPSLLDQKVV